MLKFIESTEENLLNSSNQYNCEDYIYKILLKTGQYIHAKDIIYLNVGLFLFNNLYINKSRQLYFINQTPLHIVATTKNLNLKEIGEILISKGADINAIDIIYLNIGILFLIKIIQNK